jgi:hypothetical protein
MSDPAHGQWAEFVAACADANQLHLGLHLPTGRVVCCRVKLVIVGILMKSYWLKLLLLGAFAFWASGAAKYVHEAIEHHGRDASLDDDDDDDSAGVISAAVSPQQHNPAQTTTQTAAQTKTETTTETSGQKKGPCPVCQMLAAMVLHHTAPPVRADRSNLLIGTLVWLDWVAPSVLSCFASFARDPPAGAFAS